MRIDPRIPPLPPPPPLSPTDVREVAQSCGAHPDDDVHEMAPLGSVRGFRVGAVIVRVEEHPEGDALEQEERALRCVASASTPPLAPLPCGAGRLPPTSTGRPWLAYPCPEGRTAGPEDAAAHAEDFGRLFARLHGCRTFDLRARGLPRRPMTLLESFKRASECLRLWLSAREADGLSQDLLTLTLLDLQRALRPYMVALDHLFLSARRPVLCHGRPEPSRVVRTSAGSLMFAGLGEACLGDAAEDLARFALLAELPEDAEERLLRSYLRELERLGRAAPRFLPRYFARRGLLLWSEPIQRLDGLRRLKEGRRPQGRDLHQFIASESRLTYAGLLRAINESRHLLGGVRPVSLREVESMGRLIAYEDLLVAGQTFRVALTGQPYAGKTEVGAVLARRLNHEYWNTGALGRALAWLERERTAQGAPRLPASALPRLLFASPVEMRPCEYPPFYEVHVAGEDISAHLRTPDLQVRGAAFLDKEAVLVALREEIAARQPARGWVVEGSHAHSLLGAGQRHFHLTCAREVRRARLMGHRPDVEGELEGDALLARLDEAALPPLPDAQPIDLGSRPATSAALDILWHLLPDDQRPPRPMSDLSGRTPLFGP